MKVTELLLLILFGFCILYLIEIVGNFKLNLPVNSDNFKAGCYIKNDAGEWVKYEVKH